MVEVDDPDLIHDLSTLADMDTREELDLNPDTELSVVLDNFYTHLLPRYVKAGIVLPDLGHLSKDVCDGYLRVLKGDNYDNPGTSDWLSYLFAGLIWGEEGYIYMKKADEEDTFEQLAYRILPKGQDNEIVEELMKFPLAQQVYADLENIAITLIKWSFEDPDSRFQPVESGSVRYLNMSQTSNGKKFNCIDTHRTYLNHFGKQYTSGTVSKHIPTHFVGFGHASGRGFFDYVTKQARKFNNAGLIPQWSWMAQQI
jgi:hypothetical protein